MEISERVAELEKRTGLLETAVIAMFDTFQNEAVVFTICTNVDGETEIEVMLRPDVARQFKELTQELGMLRKERMATYEEWRRGEGQGKGI